MFDGQDRRKLLQHVRSDEALRQRAYRARDVNEVRPLVERGFDADEDFDSSLARANFHPAGRLAHEVIRPMAETSNGAADLIQQSFDFFFVGIHPLVNGRDRVKAGDFFYGNSPGMLRKIAFDSDVKVVLKEALSELHKYAVWSASFPETLQQAQRQSTDIPEGYVWQDELVELWRPLDAIQKRLLEASDSLEEMLGATAWEEIEKFLDPPNNAQIEFATDDTRFFDRPGYVNDQIAYSERRLMAWHRRFSRWLAAAIEAVKSALAQS